MTALADEVIEVFAGALLHQRHRWGPLMAHPNGFEGWWKGEFTQALESWCWSTPGYDPVELGVRVEAHPRAFGIPSKDSCCIDLLLAPWDRGVDGLSTERGPRVWVELKDRGTWWSSEGKALDGLDCDIKKLESIDWGRDDAALAVLVLRHDGVDSDVLPGGELQRWATAIRSLAGSRRVIESPYVGYPLPGEPYGGGRVRWARIFAVEVHPADR